MSPPSPVPPHSSLRQYYGTEEERPRYVDRLFDDAAPHYEWINRVMSLGFGESYRRTALLRAGLGPGMRLLDIATGTGLVLRAGASIVGRDGRAVGLDPSAGMLHECRKSGRPALVQARGEALPFGSGCFDFVSLGYGLRHVADLAALFGECLRVLRSGRRLLVLEFARPRSALGLRLGRLYLQTLVPLVTRIGTRSPRAEQVMRYCWDTVDQAVPPEVVLGAIECAGFEKVERRTVGGIFAEYSAAKLPEG